MMRSVVVVYSVYNGWLAGWLSGGVSAIWSVSILHDSWFLYDFFPNRVSEGG